MKDTLSQWSERLGYTFNDISILDQALRHRSAGLPNNERLEFLGDSVLGFVISSELYQRHPDAKEGDLSRMRSSLVNGEVLAEIAVELQVNDCLHLGMGEQKSGGINRPSMLADAMEAIFGAIYLDGGLDACWQCIMKLYGEQVDDLSNVEALKDPKSQLQEWLQARKLPLPTYASTVTGQAHELTFKIICTVDGLDHQAEGVSTSRRKAEQVAAQQFLDILHGKK